MPRPAPCPPIFDLTQFLLGELDAEVSQSLESHLTSCTECQEKLTTISAEDEFVQALRTASTRRGTEHSIQNLPDAPEKLVNLLVPHFKQIATALEKTALFRSAQDFVDTTNLSYSPTLRQISPGETFGTQQLGRYEIRGVLGRGGMGTVLHAFDPLLKRSIAIKVIHPKLLAKEGMTGRLVREAQAAAAVEHDHIVSVYAVEMHDDAPCIVMPVLRGMTLKQRLEEITGPLPLSEILRIGREAATGLAAAHAVGLIHCDIKPANLWLEAPLGRAKILDFGLAIVRGDMESDSGEISGTPGYLAPEQARGVSLDQRTDIFSLGCVLYRMATGVAPFTGERAWRALWTVLADAPVPAEQLNSLVPYELSNLISRMLAQDPDKRPTCATEVVESLSTFERRLVEQKSKVVRRRWLGAMAMVALLSGGGAGWWAMLNAIPVEAPVKITFAGDEPPLAVLIRYNGQEQPLTLGRERTLDLVPGDYTIRAAVEHPGLTLVPNHFSVAAARPQTLRIALAGEIARHATHTLPVTCVAVHPGPNRTVYSAGLDRTLVEWDPFSARVPRFINLPHSARCLAVSPNGKNVATGGGNKQPPAELEIRVWNSSDLSPCGEPLLMHSRIVNALAYSPDGTLMASAGADSLFLWNSGNDASQELVHTEPQTVLALAFSTDSRQLLTGSDIGQIVAWDIGTRMPRQTYSANTSAVRTVAFLAERLVAAGDDGSIRIWNEGTLQHEWAGHADAVLALAVSPNGKQVLSGDAEGAIRVWSVSSGQAILVWPGNQQAVNALAFTDHGRQAVSGGADGVVRLWRLPFSE